MVIFLYNFTKVDMLMKILKTYFEKAFFIIVFVLSCLTMNSDNLTGYMRNMPTQIIALKCLLIIVFVVIATYINRNRVIFLSKVSSAVTGVVTALVIFDIFITKFSGSQFLYSVWWIISIFVAQITLFTVLSAAKTIDYKYFYDNFWLSFMPLYIFVLMICFLRQPYSGRTINAVPFHGTFLMLETFLKNPAGGFEAPLLFFGNLLIFIPMPFIIKRLLRNVKSIQIIAIGFIIPVIVEGYQYFLECGDVDVDDLILNWLGFLLGFAVDAVCQKKINEKL